MIFNFLPISVSLQITPIKLGLGFPVLISPATLDTPHFAITLIALDAIEYIDATFRGDISVQGESSSKHIVIMSI